MEAKTKNSNKVIKIFCMFCMVLFSVLLYVYMAYVSYQRKETVSGPDAYFVVQNIIYILLLILLVAVCMYALFDRKGKVKPERMYLLAGLVLGFVFLLLIPLMAVPDEHTHMYTSYDVSDSIMGTHGDTLMMRADDAYHRYQQVKLDRSGFNIQYEGAFSKVGNAEMVDTEIVANQSPRYLFFVSALGITLGRLLGLSTTLTMLLGRLFNMLVFVAAVYYAVKRMPFGKGVVVVWALLPITLQQVCSFSYDSPIFALSILVIATTLSAVYGNETDKKKKITNYVVMGISCLLLLPCKGYALLPLVVLPLMLIPRYLKAHPELVARVKEKIRIWMKVVAICILIAVVCVAGVVAVRVIGRLLLPENINNNYIEWADHTGFTVGYFLKKPVHFLEIMLNTVWYKADVYLSQMLGGSLGWLEIDIPFVFVLGFLFVLVYAAMRKENEQQLIRDGERVWMVLVFVGVSCLAIAAMLFYWTPNNAVVVEGFQGRYILPVLVLGLLALRTKRTSVSEYADHYAVMWTVFLHFLVVTAVFRDIP